MCTPQIIDDNIATFQRLNVHDYSLGVKHASSIYQLFMLTRFLLSSMNLGCLDVPGMWRIHIQNYLWSLTLFSSLPLNEHAQQLAVQEVWNMGNLRTHTSS
jgi:hypothetical protein